eukprot:6242275-Alexandrium_andersonii.AAC.1
MVLTPPPPLMCKTHSVAKKATPAGTRSAARQLLAPPQGGVAAARCPRTPVERRGQGAGRSGGALGCTEGHGESETGASVTCCHCCCCRS